LSFIGLFHSDCKNALVQIQFRLTPITDDNAPENTVAAFRTDIAGFFICNPFFSADFPPIGNGPQDYFFADCHGKIVDMPTRKFIALMTSGVTSLFCAGPDVTLFAMHKQIIGQASVTPDFFG
jgi:hypothetical protein